MIRRSTLISGARRGAQLALVALAAAALALPGTSAANESSCASDAPPKPSPRIVRTQVEGLFVNVLLPSDYDTSGTRRYPVLYLLHALQYNENTWLDLTDVEKFTAGFQGDQAAIVVMPDGGPGGWYTNWPDGTEQWETYHLAHLIPAIDAGFRTLADRGHRAAAGFSMGGYGALLYAARHPDLFSVAGGFSPISHITAPQPAYAGAPAADPQTDAGSPGKPFGGRQAPAYRTPDDANSGCNNSGSQWGSGVDDVNWHGLNPTDLASNMRGQTVYVASGDGTPCSPDDPVDRPTFIEPGDAATLVMTRDYFVPAARAAHANVVTDFYGCGVHTMKYGERDLHQFWPVMTKAFGSSPPAAFDHRSIDSDFSVWGWTFHADPGRAAEFLEVRGADAHGLTLTGSGTETVVTAAVFRPHQLVAVTGAKPAEARADADGRLVVAVDLGAPHTADQFTPESTGEQFVTRQVRFQPRAGPPACTDTRKFRFRLHHARHARVVKVEVRVNGRRVLLRRGRDIEQVVLERLPTRSFRVTIIATQSTGHRLISTRRYRGCTKTAPTTRHGRRR